MQRKDEDNNTIVLTAEIRQLLDEGGAETVYLPLDRIVYASNTGDGFGDGFHNPRLRKGFDPDSMAELADSIAQDGLMENLIVRRKPGPDGMTFEIVAGERRTRAIRSLVEADRLVKNLRTGKMDVAAKVYQTVPCQIRGQCDDITAMRIAVQENETHVALSDADLIDLAKGLEARGKSRAEICDMMGKSQAWLCHTLGFESNLTSEAYHKLRSGEICRSVAIKLADYPAKQQEPILAAATERARSRHVEVTQQIEAEIEDAKAALVTAAQTKVKVVSDRGASPQEKEKAAAKLDRANKVLAKLKERREATKGTRVTPSQTDIVESAYAITGRSHKGKGLTPAQIREYFVDKGKELLAFGGNPIDEDTGLTLHRRDLQVAVAIAEGIAGGSRNLIDILTRFSSKSVPAGSAIPKPTSDFDFDNEDEDEIDIDDDEDLDFFDLDDGEDSSSMASRLGSLDLSTLGIDNDD